MRKLLCITEKDLEFKELIANVAKKCWTTPLKPGCILDKNYPLCTSCFWAEHYYTEICKDISLEYQPGKIYSGKCPVGNLFQKIRDNAPTYFSILRNFYKNVPYDRQYYFLMFFLCTVGTIYSVNREEVPSMDKKSVQQEIKIPAKEIATRLAKLDHFWFDDLHNQAISQRVVGRDWEKFLKLLNTFMEEANLVIGPIEPLNNREALHQEITNFLNKR